MLESLRPRPPHRIRYVCGNLSGEKKLPGVTWESCALRQLLLGGCRGRVTRKYGHHACVDASKSGRILLRARKASLDWTCHALSQFLTLTGYEVADLQQAGPHSITVVVLRISGQGPAGLLSLLQVRPQEFYHTLENLCFLHLRIFKLLLHKKK